MVKMKEDLTERASKQLQAIASFEASERTDRSGARAKGRGRGAGLGGGAGVEMG